MQHTYLRYECADTFSLTSAAPSTTTNTTQTIALFPSNNDNPNIPSNSRRSDQINNHNSLIVTIAGSQCAGFDLRSGNPSRPYLKFGHYDDTTNVGTGKALNGSECTCLDVYVQKIGTGWVDGSIRIFDIVGENAKEGKTKNSSDLGIAEGTGVVNSLLHGESETWSSSSSFEPPLVFNGHSNSPITCVSFDQFNAGSRLASGSADGSVVIWDIVAETGLFRLLGHNKTITTLHFTAPKQQQQQQQQQQDSPQQDSPNNYSNLNVSFDGLVSTSLDGLVKVWDLDGQCCAQTIGGHRGEVWASDFAVLQEPVTETRKEQNRWRMVTGASDNELRFWAVHAPRRTALTEKQNAMIAEMDTNGTDNPISDEDALTYMGSIKRQTNERASLVKFYTPTKLLAVSAQQSKNIELYTMRSVAESEKRRVRRLRRRREKEGKKMSTSSSKSKTKGMLDDDSDKEEQDGKDELHNKEDSVMGSRLSPDHICASDEFTFLGTIRASHKVRSFVFAAATERGGGTRIIISLATNALEVHTVQKTWNQENGTLSLVTRKTSTLDQYGHPTGIRSVALSPTDDKLATTISKGMLKVWSVPTRNCIRSLPLHYSNENGPTSAVYALCCAFLPSNSHVVVGTREGHILLLDIGSGDVVCIEQNAHDGAIWALDVISDGSGMVTGSADHSAKFWEFEDNEGDPALVHIRTLEMKDDVVSARYSMSYKKRLVMIATLDCTIQIFFEDNLKFFLNLYGHKLPALGMDCSDDDAILASGGADKTIKIWGLDFGDVHKTLYGHTDSITDIKFVRKTHNFFSCGRDKTIRYWDGDRFESILVLHGHFAEVNSLAISKTGAFLLSAGMDRQIRVWERTKDMVFVEEEKERELERMMDEVDGSRGEGKISMRPLGNEDPDDGDDAATQPQTEAAVRRSVLSVASGDRIMEAIELADSELKENSSKTNKNASPNPLLLGMDPPQYIFWVLRTIKSVQLEQSLLVLPLNHMERLMYYLIILLRKGVGVEICSKVAIFLVKTHQNQIIATHTLAIPLRELRRLVKIRVGQCRNSIGYNLAAMRAVARTVQERKHSFVTAEDNMINTDIWSGLGKGSDVAAALVSRDKKRIKR